MMPFSFKVNVPRASLPEAFNHVPNAILRFTRTFSNKNREAEICLASVIYLNTGDVQEGSLPYFERVPIA